MNYFRFITVRCILLVWASVFLFGPNSLNAQGELATHATNFTYSVASTDSGEFLHLTGGEQVIAIKHDAQFLGWIHAGLLQYLFFAMETGFEDIQVEAVVYPNPFSSKLQIEIPGGTEKKSISIYTVNGQLVSSKESMDELIELNLTELPVGNYYLFIKTDTALRYFPIIKKY